MNILFLDLSTKSTGWAVGDQSGALKDYGCITESSQNFVLRIYKMNQEIQKIIDKYEITKIIAEEVRTDYKNPHVYKLLTWLQGVVIVTAFGKNDKIDFEFIQPSSWRSKIGIHTGRGIKRDELKKEDIKYVKNKYHIDENDDVCDAICLHDSYYVSENPW